MCQPGSSVYPKSAPRYKKLNPRDETHDERDKDECDRQPDEDRAERGNPPRHARVVPTPAEPEDAYDQNGSTKHGRVQALFCRWKSVPLLEETRVSPHEPQVDDGGKDGPDADTDEDEAVVRHRKVACANEDHGNGLEHCTIRSRSSDIRMTAQKWQRIRTCVDDAIRD